MARAMRDALDPGTRQLNWIGRCGGQRYVRQRRPTNRRYQDSAYGVGSCWSTPIPWSTSQQSIAGHNATASSRIVDAVSRRGRPADRRGHYAARTTPTGGPPWVVVGQAVRLTPRIRPPTQSHIASRMSNRGGATMHHPHTHARNHSQRSALASHDTAGTFRSIASIHRLRGSSSPDRRRLARQ